MVDCAFARYDARNISHWNGGMSIRRRQLTSPVMTQLWLSPLVGQHRRRWVGYFDDSYLQQSWVNGSRLWSWWKRVRCKGTPLASRKIHDVVNVVSTQHPTFTVKMFDDETSTTDGQNSTADCQIACTAIHSSTL